MVSTQPLMHCGLVHFYVYSLFTVSLCLGIKASVGRVWVCLIHFIHIPNPVMTPQQALGKGLLSGQRESQ